MLQGQRDLAAVGKMLLSELVPLVNAHQGVIYQMDMEGEPHLNLLASYANDQKNGYPARLLPGDGFIGNAPWKSAASLSPTCRPRSAGSDRC